jgi:hypothetical protein
VPSKIILSLDFEHNKMQANLQSNSADGFIALGPGFLSPFLSFGISVKNM